MDSQTRVNPPKSHSKCLGLLTHRSILLPRWRMCSIDSPGFSARGLRAAEYGLHGAIRALGSPISVQHLCGLFGCCGIPWRWGAGDDCHGHEGSGHVCLPYTLLRRCEPLSVLPLAGISSINSQSATCADQRGLKSKIPISSLHLTCDRAST